MLLIDITQDGAGLVRSDSKQVDGIITGLVETCSVYVFYGSDALALIHDTGQLAINEILNFAKKTGKIRSAYCAINPDAITKKQLASHRDRRTRLRNLLRIKEFVKLDIPDGNLVCLKTGKILCRDGEMLALKAGMASIPERDKRKAINELNNLFSAKNSQSLPLDFQFNGDTYTDLPRLLKTEDEMRVRAELELKRGDSDYLNFLNNYKSMGYI